MKKFFSILLSIILVASHLSLTRGTHFCHGEVVETKILLGKMDLDCGMQNMREYCDITEKSTSHELYFGNVPCCQNEYQTIHVTDEFVKDAAQFSFSFNFSSAFIYSTLNPDLFSKSTTQQFYTEYSPPPLEKDLEVLFESFLIWIHL